MTPLAFLMYHHSRKKRRMKGKKRRRNWVLRKVGFFLILSGGGSGTNLLAVSLFVVLVNVIEVDSIGSRLILWRLRRLQHVVQDHLKSGCEAFVSRIIEFGLFNLLDKRVDKRKGGVLVKNGIG